MKIDEAVSKHFQYSEGKFWAICFLLRTVIRESRISEDALAKCIEDARKGYPAVKDLESDTGMGFEEAVKNICYPAPTTQSRLLKIEARLDALRVYLARALALTGRDEQPNEDMKAATVELKLEGGEPQYEETLDGEIAAIAKLCNELR